MRKYILGLLLLILVLSAWSQPNYRHRPRPRPTPTATAIPTSAPTQGMLLTDEFNGSALDTSKWFACPSGCYPPNNELEVYWSTNVSVHDGMLDLVALKAGNSYTSGKVMSYKSFLYGHVEARVLIPYGQGLWPAFWLLHDADESNSNEIDIMESVNNEHIDYMSLHYTLNGQFRHATSSVPISADWHILALDWYPGKLVWSIDGIPAFTITDKAKIPNTSMFVIINLALGGEWSGSPDSTTVFPSHFMIDYLRVTP